MTSSVLVRGLEALALLVAATSAQASPTVYFGENQSPGALVSGAPVTARDSFLSQLTGVRTENFESFAFGTGAPIIMAFTGSGGSTLNATLSGQGQVENRLAAGRFNTSPNVGSVASTKWWDVLGNFSITFNSPISAFGFYGTDIGDFNGQVTLALTAFDDTVTKLTVNNTVNGRNGSLLFYGFIDPTITYKSIAFGSTGTSGADFFGFDDMIVGDQRQISGTVPEPGTLALVGLSLLCLTALRRRA